jgi:hypothetical protein
MLDLPEWLEKIQQEPHQEAQGIELRGFSCAAA